MERASRDHTEEIGQTVASLAEVDTELRPLGFVIQGRAGHLQKTG